jgi:hypothetical protein
MALPDPWTVDGVVSRDLESRTLAVMPKDGGWAATLWSKGVQALLGMRRVMAVPLRRFRGGILLVTVRWLVAVRVSVAACGLTFGVAGLVGPSWFRGLVCG